MPRKKHIMCKNPRHGAHRRLLGLTGNQEGPGEKVEAAEGKAEGGGDHSLFLLNKFKGSHILF